MPHRSKPHIHVTAALIRKNGQFLITKRPEGGHLGGYWEFPGGKQEEHESLQQCLEREIREELGLIIRAEKGVLTIEHEYETRVVSLHVHECTILGGTPQAIECQEFRWVAPESLREYAFPPPDIEVIEMLNANLSQTNA